MEECKIEIAKEFSEKIGGRWIKLGPYSGEDFFNKLLKPKYLEAVNSNRKLHIYLDGTKGYGSSFLDQSFGQLSRDYGIENVRKNIEFHSQFFDWIVKYINEEIWK
ncbi:MAG: DUF4325 domain-containing protein [Sphingobacteriaceae bacterium]|nr:DUF4325 domain-containing protein [Sphingobacteriaceae bacterium]